MTRSSPGMGSLSPGIGGMGGTATRRGAAGRGGGAAWGVARGVVVIGVSVSAGGLVSEVDGTGTSTGAGSAVAGAGAGGVVVTAGAVSYTH
ncbi:PE family protein, partial [Mycobacterium intracellulare]